MTQKHASNRHTNVHGSMNMRALLLHVFGDALGNVGVIATGLVIWLTEWKYKLYFDPIISLVITIIIFSSALPLGAYHACSCCNCSETLHSSTVRSASFILLQAVPHSVSPDSVRNEILKVDGVLSLHELHIWQLSESKLIASVHVLASREHDFMPIAKGVRKILHQHGVHSCTIQPEYCSEDSVEDSVDVCRSFDCSSSHGLKALRRVLRTSPVWSGAQQIRNAIQRSTPAVVSLTNPHTSTDHSSMMIRC
jgi:Co/Zn/Cd efflux system component